MSVWLLALLFVSSCAYQGIATVLASRFRGEQKRPANAVAQRFSQVKPVAGVNETTLSAIESFLEQDGVPVHDVYLCSAAEAPLPWLSRHGQVSWLKLHAQQDQNGKAATLAEATRYWSGEIFVISDADMWAPPSYLGKVLEEFSDLQVGVVTCLYRSTSPVFGDWCHLLEALCIQDFAASVLVARQTEELSFAMGSTMAIRRQALEEVGGFEALTPYLADDYQLGYRAHQAGWKVRLASTVLETEPPRGKLAKALSHQYRWLVTSRVSRPGGHFAFIITQGFLWATLLVALKPALGVPAFVFWCLLRVVCGAKTYRDLGGAGSLWQVMFLPWKDALYLGLWLASLRGDQVRWGDRKLRIDRQGRIVS